MMSPFFSNPQFIAATHDDRVRRLRQVGRLRRGEPRIDKRRRRRG
jgi:hypothetical protein